MEISPSIASGNLLRIEDEIKYIDNYFNSIHIDIEDGVAVNNISFGFKLAKAICDISTSKEKTIHLEVIDPLKYINAIKSCNATTVFIQTDVLKEPLRAISAYKNNGICVGVNISNIDITRNDYKDIISSSEYILVNTTHHDDIKQVCDPNMVKEALRLAENKKVWIDGGITREIFEQLHNSKIHSAVMGRAIFSDRNKAKEMINSDFV